MDWLTFIDHETQHLVWPLVVVFGLLSQHRAVGGLIKGIENLKLKWGDKEASVAMRSLSHTVDVAEAIAVETVPDEMPALPPAEPPLKRVPDPIDDAEVEPLVLEDKPPKELRLPLSPRAERLKKRAADIYRERQELGYVAPKVVIERAWVEVRDAVFSMLGLSTPSRRYFDMDSLPDEELITELKADPRVDSALLRAIVELKMVRNDATTTIGWQPTRNEAGEYKLNAQRVIELVEAAATKKPE